MTTNVNSYGIANGMFASDPIPTRGMGKRAVLGFPAACLPSVHAFTLQGYLAAVQGPISGISSLNANWAPIMNAATGSQVTFSTNGNLAVALAQDVVQSFDAIRLVSTSAVAAAANFFVLAKAG